MIIFLLNLFNYILTNKRARVVKNIKILDLKYYFVRIKYRNNIFINFIKYKKFTAFLIKTVKLKIIFIMNSFDQTLLILLILLILGIISHNTNITLAVLFLLAIRILTIDSFFNWIEKHSFTTGILILTIGVINPIANGKISATDVMNSFLDWKSLLAIFIGIFVSWLGNRGIILMSKTPSTVTGLLIGTFIGVSLFKGIPVGPLIAAGILSLIIGKN